MTIIHQHLRDLIFRQTNISYVNLEQYVLWWRMEKAVGSFGCSNGPSYCGVCMWATWDMHTYLHIYIYEFPIKGWFSPRYAAKNTAGFCGWPRACLDTTANGWGRSTWWKSVWSSLPRSWSPVFGAVLHFANGYDFMHSHVNLYIYIYT